jgi:transketolase C-terminal domain/subunit
MIRNYLNHENIPVNIIGGGRDKDYGYLGFSHWAEDDKIIMKCFENVKLYHPETEQELISVFKSLITHKIPSYLNLKK